MITAAHKYHGTSAAPTKKGKKWDVNIMANNKFDHIMVQLRTFTKICIPSIQKIKCNDSSFPIFLLGWLVHNFCSFVKIV